MGEYEFKEDWFSHCKHLFDKYLCQFKGQPVNFLEIGSFEARSACYMLDSILSYNHLATLTCVDPHLDSIVKYRFKKNLATYLSSGQCIYHNTTSLNYFLNVKNSTANHFDFIYIDGAHDQQSVLTDVVMSFVFLKVDGIIALDDYEWEDKNYPGVRPKEAIDGFLESFKHKIEVVHKGYQVWLIKKDN